MDWAERVSQAKRESKRIEFKTDFDPTSTAGWCEILKDIIAMSNSGGGVIAFGLDSRGHPTGNDLSRLLLLDPSVVSDKVYQYTGVHFSSFELLEGEKDRSRIAVLQIEASNVPLVFTKPGTYPVQGSNQQKTAFSQGTVYFRHGAKSEPGNHEDLRQFFERRLEAVRKEWIDGVHKVVKAPEGSKLTVVPTGSRDTGDLNSMDIRFTNDPSAPEFRGIDHDVTHPYRQKELVTAINRRLPYGVRINSYDVLVVRRNFGVDSRPEFCHHPKFGSPQYSNVFVDWLIDQYQINSAFFQDARKAFKNRIQ